MKEISRLSKKTSKTNLQGTSKMYNKQKGITLIALVITVVILIILATVTLNVVLGEGGLIQRAQQAKELTEQAALTEQQSLNSLMSEYANIMAEDQNPPIPKSEVEEAKESGTPFEDTTTITDDLDNEVTIPGEFHIAEDSGTKVEEGIVIEDDSGNQFVWIPVGEYNVSTTINSTGKLTNELTRRTFTEEGSMPVSGDDAIAGPKAEENNEYYYGEGNENSVAKEQIGAFKTSATTNKGFYIGKYEAGTETERTLDAQLTKPLVQANKYPYIWITSDEAKQQAEAMYNGNEFVTSELISSYAWDTALNFICQTNEEGYLLATTTDDAYGNINKGYSNTNRTQTGEYSADNYSNINDLLGNCSEETTEYSSYTSYGHSYPCVGRGSSYSSSNNFAARRGSGDPTGRSATGSFRIQLYVNAES